MNECCKIAISSALEEAAVAVEQKASVRDLHVGNDFDKAAQIIRSLKETV